MRFKLFREFINDIPGDAPGDEQVHVFDFDDTLGVTKNASGVMPYNDGEPILHSEEEAREWLKSLGIGEKDLLKPGIKEIPERDGWAVYVNSAALIKIQKAYPQQGVTGVKEVPKKGEAILLDFTPSAHTSIVSTKPIERTVQKLKKANAEGAETVVVTARTASGVRKNFTGKDVHATNARDIKKFLADKGAKPTDGVIGASGMNKGEIIADKFFKRNDKPEEVHFYDDAERNVQQVKDRLAGKEPSELYIYGPGDFAKGEVDPNKPTEKYITKKKKR